MYFRTLALWLVGLPVTGILFVFVLLALPFSRGGSAIHAIGALWCRVVLALSGVRVEMEGLEKVPSSGPVIFAANHQGIFDIPVLQGRLPFQYRWVAKESLFKIPIIGWTMSFTGYIGINRESASKAFRSIQLASEKIGAGTSVLIFPEGTRNRGEGLLPFKRGIFMLATKSGAPVVPVSISGTRDIMRSGGVAIRPHAVRVRIGDPVETRGREEPEVMALVREAITKGLA